MKQLSHLFSRALLQTPASRHLWVFWSGLLCLGALAILWPSLVESRPARLVAASFGFTLVFWCSRSALCSRSFFLRFIGVCSARELGIYRFAIASVVLLQVASEPLTALVHVPSELRRPMGAMHLFRPFLGENFLQSSHAVLALQVGTCALLVLSAAGLFTRITLPLAAIFSLICEGLLREFSHFFHTGLLSLQLLMLLVFLPCADGFSVDALRKVPLQVGRKRSFIAYGYARYVLWLWIAGVYFCTGISKLRAGAGLAWTAPNNLRRLLFRDFLHVDFMHFDAAEFILRAPDAFFVALGFFTLALELLYPSVLFSRRARLLFPVLAAGMHLGILFFQGFTFFDCLLLNLVFAALSASKPFSRSKRPTPPSTRHRESRGPNPTRHLAARGAKVLAVAVLVAPLQAFVWLGRIDYYPATQWALYSSVVETTSTEFYQIESSDALGQPLGNLFAKCNRFYHHNARWRDLVWKALKSEAETCGDWFRACISQYNLNLTSDKQAQKLSVSLHAWDFVEHANAVAQAKLLRSCHVTVEDPPRESSATPTEP